jgi:Tfp pilus assembly protein PilP
MKWASLRGQFDKHYMRTAVSIIIIIIIINCNCAYAWWQCLKKWTYIARKQNIHLTKIQHISQNFTVQYKCNEQKASYRTHKKKTERQQNTESNKTWKQKKNHRSQGLEETLHNLHVWALVNPYAN